MKIDVMGDTKNGKMVINLWLSGSGIDTEVNLSERRATMLMAKITKAMHECRIELAAQPPKEPEAK